MSKLSNKYAIGPVSFI